MRSITTFIPVLLILLCTGHLAGTEHSGSKIHKTTFPNNDQTKSVEPMEVNAVAFNDNSPAPKQLNEKLSNKKETDSGLPYSGVFNFGDHQGYLQLPEKYTPDHQHPFILFFHGRGGSVKNHNFMSNEFAAFRKLCSGRGFIVAVPGYGSDCWLNGEAEIITHKMVNHLEKRLSIHPDRIYAMGVSMGGGSALVYTIRHPEKVAAVCDVFGITDYARFYHEGFYNKSIAAAYGGTPLEQPDYYSERSAINHIHVLKNKRVMIIHGDRDGIVPKWNSDNLARKLKAAGGNVNYIVVPGLGHSNAIISKLEEDILNHFENRSNN